MQSPLKPVEHEIMLQLAEGMNTKAIAAARGVRASTIRSQLHNAYRRLGVANGTAAVAKMFRSGMLDDPPLTGSEAAVRDDGTPRSMQAYVTAFDVYIETGSAKARAAMGHALRFREDEIG